MRRRNERFPSALFVVGCALVLSNCAKSSISTPHSSLDSSARIGPTQEPNPPRKPDAQNGPKSRRAPKPNGPEPNGPELVGTSPLSLELPVDDEFLDRSLPAADPARYRGFREKGRIWVGKGYLERVELLPGGRALLVSSSDEPFVRLFDRGSRRPIGRIDLTEFSSRGADAVPWPETRDGTEALVAATERGLTLIAVSGEVLGQLDSSPVDELSWSEDGQLLLTNVSDVASQTSKMNVFRRDGASLVQLGSLAFEERVDGWALSRDNRLLAVSHFPSDDLRVLDLKTGRDVLRVPGPRYAGSVALSPDGRYVAMGGAGLLVVDLVNPKRRAYYGQFYNNIHRVLFSPSGDAVATASYDGRVRLFQLENEPFALRAPHADTTITLDGLHIRLLSELRHTKTANVYGLAFDEDGSGLWSSSGDQTVRWFGGPARRAPTRVDPEKAGRFLSLKEWRKKMHDEPPWPVAPPPSLKQGHYFPPAAELPARPTRLVAGMYSCKITPIYRMRDCVVMKDAEGHTWLEFGPGNLLELEALVYDEGAVTFFEGYLQEPTNIISCPGCEKQPLWGVLRGSGGKYRGLLTFREYYDPYRSPPRPPSDAKVEEANDRFPILLELEQRASPPAPPSPRPPNEAKDHPAVLELNEP